MRVKYLRVFWFKIWSF